MTSLGSSRTQYLPPVCVSAERLFPIRHVFFYGHIWTFGSPSVGISGASEVMKHLPPSALFQVSTLTDIIKKAVKASHRHHIQCGQCLVSSQVIIVAETKWKLYRAARGGWMGVDSGRGRCYTSDEPKAQSFSHKSVIVAR